MQGRIIFAIECFVIGIYVSTANIMTHLGMDITSSGLVHVIGLVLGSIALISTIDLQNRKEV